jgi:hypothetical protein
MLKVEYRGDKYNGPFTVWTGIVGQGILVKSHAGHYKDNLFHGEITEYSKDGSYKTAQYEMGKLIEPDNL